MHRNISARCAPLPVPVLAATIPHGVYVALLAFLFEIEFHNQSGLPC
jgi:hypothetical protein